MNYPKIFAAYLPQFHETKTNNKFWGKGFTDWEGVKKATPQFDGHNQPRVPLNDNYYDLSDVKTLKWQAEIAKKYGVDGFNIYHYWFKDGKQELQKPAELLLENKDINIEFFFTWDNCSWKRTWSNLPGNDWGIIDGDNKTDDGMLLELDYGNEDEWIKHFNYLLTFFKDERYLKIENKPVFVFMTAIKYPELNKMIECWRRLAVENGFNGMFIMSQKGLLRKKVDSDEEFYYEPINSSWGMRRLFESKISQWINLKLYDSKSGVKYKYRYEYVWEKILKRTSRYKKSCVQSCFVRYDDTPRRGKNAGVIVGESPDLFEKYFEKFYRVCYDNSTKITLITAWNEWGEGAYLEPDKDIGYKYLESIYKVKSKIINKCES